MIPSMKRNRNQVGFALPTVIITSIIMMIVLLSALTAASSVQASLKQNYYDRVARNAAESGSVYAGKCLISGDYSEGVDITPRTNCKGVAVAGRLPYVQNTPQLRSTFAFRISSVGNESRTKIATITGRIEFLSESGAVQPRTVESQLKQRFSLEQDEKEIRATQAKWYFGSRATMDFGTSGKVGTVGVNSQISAYAGEGSTTVNDGNGNILFWSNGITIWDKYGNTMPNGTGLLGHNSATQSVAAFPFDDKYSKFGIVSNKSVDESGGAKELYFSVVDMSLNNGRGDVTAVKNVRLGGLNYAYEGIGAMPSNRRGEFWVYAYHTANRLITRFRVGINGVVEGPLTTYINPQGPMCTSSSIGYGTFNFSKDYTKMLLYAGTSGCADTTAGRAYIYETNQQTGALTQLSSWLATSGVVASGYSADFSPSEDYVYITQLYPGRLNRYTVKSNNIPSTSAEVKASEWTSPSLMTNAPQYASQSYNVFSQAGGQVKRGPDGRMYIADQAYKFGKQLGEAPFANITCKFNVINNPDAASTDDIGLVIGGVSLPQGACSTFGMTQMATVFKPKSVLY